MTLTTIDDAVEWVLGHPERFFRTGAANEVELAQWVWMDAALSGVPDVLVHHELGVWVVAGSANWLADQKLTVGDLFERVVPLSAGGPNSMRSEILLNAFCSEVVAVVSGAVAFTKGTGSVRAVIDRVLQDWVRLEAAIGFRL